MAIIIQLSFSSSAMYANWETPTPETGDSGDGRLRTHSGSLRRHTFGDDSDFGRRLTPVSGVSLRSQSPESVSESPVTRSQTCLRI